MSSCRGCKKEFIPAKSYFNFCDSCIKKAAKCKTCGKIVLAKNGVFKCCGHEECAKPSRFAGKSLDEILFIMEYGVTYAEAARDEKIWELEDAE
jgi:hypothetical protein